MRKKNKLTYHNKALEKLKLLRDRIDGIIECMEIGEEYNPYVIKGSMVDLLMETRDELVLNKIELMILNQRKKNETK